MAIRHSIKIEVMDEMPVYVAIAAVNKIIRSNDKLPAYPEYDQLAIETFNTTVRYDRIPDGNHQTFRLWKS